MSLKVLKMILLKRLPLSDNIIAYQATVLVIGVWSRIFFKDMLMFPIAQTDSNMEHYVYIRKMNELNLKKTTFHHMLKNWLSPLAKFCVFQQPCCQCDTLSKKVQFFNFRKVRFFFKGAEIVKTASKSLGIS
jgi:hypothetical protein